jgi:hypothetical protein
MISIISIEKRLCSKPMNQPESRQISPSVAVCITMKPFFRETSFRQVVVHSLWPLFIENSEGIWYVDKKGGRNADKYKENRTTEKEKENQPGKKEKESHV